jgi:hypothetical protein
MSGTVGVIADMAGRYTEFSKSLLAMSANVPVNTQVDWQIGADRGRSRNQLVQRSLERGSEWILFLDDDHSFPPTLLKGLLAHDEPVVASLYLQRVDPFLPIAYDRKDENGSYWPIDITKEGQHGLVPVVGAGTGGMLIRSEVFREVAYPWFVHTTEQSEDLYFCDRLAEAGIPMYVDLDARLGHLAVFNIYPDFVEGEGENGNQWAAGISVSPSMRVLLPIVMPE